MMATKREEIEDERYKAEGSKRSQNSNRGTRRRGAKEIRTATADKQQEVPTVDKPRNTK
mgnify:CR=1 FL=1